MGSFIKEIGCAPEERGGGGSRAEGYVDPDLVRGHLVLVTSLLDGR